MTSSGQSATRAKFNWRLQGKHERTGDWIEFNRLTSLESAIAVRDRYIADGYLERQWTAFRIVERDTGKVVA